MRMACGEFTLTDLEGAEGGAAVRFAAPPLKPDLPPLMALRRTRRREQGGDLEAGRNGRKGRGDGR